MTKIFKTVGKAFTSIMSSITVSTDIFYSSFPFSFSNPERLNLSFLSFKNIIKKEKRPYSNNIRERNATCAVLLHVVHAEQFGTPDMATAAFPKVYW